MSKHSLLPFVARWHDCEDTEDLLPWLERNRQQLESMMLLFECRLIEAVQVMLLNRIANETIEINDPPPGDEWKADE